MPTVSKGGHGNHSGQTNQNSEHTKEQILQRERAGLARDDLKGAYAGDQNEAKFHREDHITNEKARSTKKSNGDDREPKI